MEDLIEFLIELVFEAGVEASENKKVPKALRVLLAIIIILLYLLSAGLILLVGVLMLEETILGGIAMLVLGLVILVALFVKMYKKYGEMKATTDSKTNIKE
ncbi:MAG: hypothetical protein IKK84_03220 [Clostridia bacterium]|nr:hypothetical protein [Clostridia bacterium]